MTEDEELPFGQNSSRDIGDLRKRIIQVWRKQIPGRGDNEGRGQRRDQTSMLRSHSKVKDQKEERR